MFDYFNVTKTDILNAFIDGFGKEQYETVRMEYDRGECKGGPFWVYDMFDENDRKEAIGRWGDLVNQWDSNRSVRLPNGNITFNELNLTTFRNIIGGVASTYRVSDYELCNLDDADDIPKKFVREDKMNPITKIYGHYEPLDKDIVDFCKKIRKDLGIITNLEVLECELSRFFIHIDDNMIWVKGTVEKGKPDEYQTEFYTYERVCEIIFNYLVKIGKINPNDKEYLESQKRDPKHLSVFDKEHGLLYDFANGKELTYRDLDDITMTCCMHEG